VDDIEDGCPGFLFEYDENARVGRFVASDGYIMLCFSVTRLQRDEAEAIALQCEGIEVWDMIAFRDAANRAMGATFGWVH
jgi:hypothetical protein